jgi:hypothetical protein
LGIAVLLVLSWVAAADAAVARSFSFQVAQAPHRLQLDPAMADPAWDAGKVPSVGSWENVTTKAPVTENPVVRLLYDDRNVYVGFIVPQAQEPIVATQTADDVGFGVDDFVAIGIDTSGNGSQAYFFETTPRGVRYEQSNQDVRYRPDWQAAARVDGGSWRAVMVIPISALRLHSGGKQNWRVSFFRGVASRGEHMTWAFDPLMQDQGPGLWPSFLDLRFWPKATGVTLAAADKPKPRLELYGLSSTGADRDLYQQTNGVFDPEKTRSYGADVSVPVTSAVNFVGTVNPDFSNVETDQQTIAPQEFPRQLAEYRPFFSQGAQYIDTNPYGYTNYNGPNNEIFYSPSVGPFDRGAKIEGTAGLESFGALAFSGVDELTGDRFDDEAYGFFHALDDRSFEYWSDGVFADHSLEGTDGTEEVGGRLLNPVSGLVELVDASTESGSWVPGGNARSTQDWVLFEKPHFEILTQYAYLSPNYDPLDGFTSISDIRGPAVLMNLMGNTPGVKNWSIFFQGDRMLDGSGAVHEADTNLFFSSVFKDGWSIDGLGPSTSELRSYDGDFFTGYPSYLDGVTVPFDLLGIPIGWHDGTPAPVDVNASFGDFGGNDLHLYTATTSRPIGSRYSLGLEYDGSYERGLTTGALDSQWLRRVSLGMNINASTNLTLELRSINGLGGFSTQTGVNLAAGFHTQTRSGDLYVNFGSPAAAATLNRLIVKYVLRFGSAPGT